ncbi:MAG: NosD domain-containing protein [Candidatus Pacearchaeota archaeon]
MSKESLVVIISILIIFASLFVIYFNTRPEFFGKAFWFFQLKRSNPFTATPISSCTTISSSGVYELQNDIINSTNDSCINIIASNVIFDGQGHTIDGNDNVFTYGIYVYNSATNVTVKNVTLSDWYAGCYFLAPNNTIQDSHITSNYLGVRVGTFPAVNSHYNTIKNNNINQNLYGIYSLRSNYLNVSYNNISLGSFGVYNSELSQYISIIDNNISLNNNTGLFFYHNANSNISNNIITLNNNGITAQHFSASFLFNNVVTQNNDTGIKFEGGVNNIVLDNIIASNRYGLYLAPTLDVNDKSTNNNITNNLIILNNYGIYVFNSTSNYFNYNNIYNSSQWDIYLTTEFYDTNIFNNQIIGNTTNISFTHKGSGGSAGIKQATSKPQDPENFSNINQYLGATASSWLHLNFSYTSQQLNGIPENTLRVAKYNGTWFTNPANFASSYGVNTENNYVYANITSFSIFAPLGIIPEIRFVSPTPSDLSIQRQNWVYVNVTSLNNLDTALLEWNSNNITMSGSGKNWYYNKTNLSSTQHFFKVYGQSSGNWNASELRRVTVDTLAPVFLQNYTNSTQAGQPILHSLTWYDLPYGYTALSGFVFSFDNCTGNFINDSWRAFRGTIGSSEQSNVVKIITSQVGCTVRWQIHANDSVGNWNSSLVYSYVTTGGGNNPPSYSTIGTNNSNPQQQEYVLHYVKWSDDSGLSGYKFSSNYSGSWQNDSWQSMTGTSNWSNITKQMPSSNGIYGWRVYANDSDNAWAATAIQTINVYSDTQAPTYSNQGYNTTEAGSIVKFYIFYNDNLALHPNGRWIFSTNNTGIWVNDSAQSWTSTPQWANVTKTLNSTIGLTIGYRWYVNDSAGNRNDTNVFTLVTTGDTTPPIVTIISPLNVTYNTQDVWANISLNEQGSWCGYSLNGQANVTMTTTNNIFFYKLLQGLSEQQHNIKFYCNDTKGNMNSSVPLRYFTVNLSAPSVCGNSICETGETQENCCKDCGCPSGKTCQNNECKTPSTGGGGGDGGGCDEGKKRCLNNLLQECKNNVWKTIENCSYGCINNSCILPQAACTQGKRCFNNFLQECLNGSWQTIEECVICSAEQLKCILCIEQEKKCSDDGKNLLTCQNGSWTSEECKYGCLNNTCLEPRSKKKFPWLVIGVIVVCVIVAIMVLAALNKLRNLPTERTEKTIKTKKEKILEWSIS